MKHRSFFITGATGLVGGYLLERLKYQPDVELHLLVRAQDHEQAIQRIHQIGQFFGHDHLQDRVTIHCGSITQPGLGLSPDAQSIIQTRITDVIHTAASISFTDEAANYAVNQLGTEHLIALIAPSARLFYVSTAYVAGMTETIREDQLDLGQLFRNDYEQSKFETERIVREHYQARPDLLTVLRPSIITGEWTTGRTFQFMTLYRVLRALTAFARRHPVSTFALNYTPDSTQNYIPIDRLTDMIEEIITTPARWGQTYHLVNDHPIINRDFRILLENHLGIAITNRPPDLRDSHLNRSAVSGNAAYLEYLMGEPVFDCTNRNQLQSAHQPMTFDADYLGRLIQFCKQSAWGKNLAISR